MAAHPQKQEEERQANEHARRQDRQMQWLTIVTVGARMNWIMSKLEVRGQCLLYFPPFSSVPS